MAEPQTFRIRPFEVQAMQWQPNDVEASAAMLAWLETLKVGPNLSDDGQTIVLMAEGTAVNPGTWVFRMPTGYVGTGPDDWFNRQYEAPTDTVTVDRQTHSWLVESALNEIWYGEQEEDSDGCCPTCCAPCAALKALLDAGQLDDAVRHRKTSAWWDEANDRVDREWLLKAWRMTSCHED